MTRYEYFLTTIKEHGDKDKCLLWPYASRGGYGIVWNDNKNNNIHRVALEYKLNRNLKPGLFSCHTCYYKNCYAPAHLYEGTPAQNSFDMITDNTNTPGEKNGYHKLTDPQILNIRESYATGLCTQYDLADEFNTSQSNISDIIRRKRWKHI